MTDQMMQSLEASEVLAEILSVTTGQLGANALPQHRSGVRKSRQTGAVCAHRRAGLAR